LSGVVELIYNLYKSALMALLPGKSAGKTGISAILPIPPTPKGEKFSSKDERLRIKMGKASWSRIDSV
jgi:hypothetical protein